MKSAEHAILGAATSGVLVVALPEIAAPLEALVLFSYGVLLSVFIDLDHFLIARYHAGSWVHFRRCVTDPVFAFTRQEQVFAGVDSRLLEARRLLSHALIGAALVAGAFLIAPIYATFTAIVLYVHVVADLLRDGKIA